MTVWATDGQQSTAEATVSNLSGEQTVTLTLPAYAIDTWTVTARAVVYNGEEDVSASFATCDPVELTVKRHIVLTTTAENVSGKAYETKVNYTLSLIHI